MAREVPSARTVLSECAKILKRDFRSGLMLPMAVTPNDLGMDQLAASNGPAQSLDQLLQRSYASCNYLRLLRVKSDQDIHLHAHQIASSAGFQSSRQSLYSLSNPLPHFPPPCTSHTAPRLSSLSPLDYFPELSPQCQVSHLSVFCGRACQQMPVQADE